MCYVLFVVASKKELLGTWYSNGNSLQLNKIVPTLYTIFKGQRKYHKHLIVVYHILKYGNRSQDASYEEMNTLIYNIDELTEPPNEEVPETEGDFMEVLETSTWSSLVYYVMDLTECEEYVQFSQYYKWKEKDGMPYCCLYLFSVLQIFRSYDDHHPVAEWLRDTIWNLKTT